MRTVVKRATVVHWNFRAGSTFPVLVCTVPSSIDWTSRCNKVDTVRRYASYRLNLLLPKGQRCVIQIYIYDSNYTFLIHIYLELDGENCFTNSNKLSFSFKH